MVAKPALRFISSAINCLKSAKLSLACHDLSRCVSFDDPLKYLLTRDGHQESSGLTNQSNPRMNDPVTPSVASITDATAHMKAKIPTIRPVTETAVLPLLYYVTANSVFCSRCRRAMLRQFGRPRRSP
jgi:hypothetical protein